MFLLFEVINNYFVNVFVEVGFPPEPLRSVMLSFEQENKTNNKPDKAIIFFIKASLDLYWAQQRDNNKAN